MRNWNTDAPLGTVVRYWVARDIAAKVAPEVDRALGYQLRAQVLGATIEEERGRIQQRRAGSAIARSARSRATGQAMRETWRWRLHAERLEHRADLEANAGVWPRYHELMVDPATDALTAMSLYDMALLCWFGYAGAPVA